MQYYFGFKGYYSIVTVPNTPNQNQYGFYKDCSSTVGFCNSCESAGTSVLAIVIVATFFAAGSLAFSVLRIVNKVPYLKLVALLPQLYLSLQQLLPLEFMVTHAIKQL